MSNTQSIRSSSADYDSVIMIQLIMSCVCSNGEHKLCYRFVHDSDGTAYRISLFTFMQKMPEWVDSIYLRSTEKCNFKKLNHSFCAWWATLPRTLSPNTTVEHKLKLKLKFYDLFGLCWCRTDVCPIGIQMAFSIIVEWQRQVCRYIWTHSTYRMRRTIYFRRIIVECSTIPGQLPRTIPIFN